MSTVQMGRLGAAGLLGEPGLRERKKRLTREAISRAALHLAMEHGPDHVRVEAIAAAAGVSPRTYNNYFSSREEAICAVAVARADRLKAALLARPAGEPLGAAVVRAVVDEHAGIEPDRRVLRLLTSVPWLRRELVRAFTDVERPLADGIAERVGLPPGDMGPAVLAAAVAAAVRVATERWLLTPADVTLGMVLAAALEHTVPALSAFADQHPPTDGSPAC